MRRRTILCLVLFYFCYLLTGAAIFWALEFTHEQNLCQETIAELQGFNITSTPSENVTVADLRRLLQIAIQANANGVRFDSSLTPSCAYNWEYQNAFFFAGTVVTTIGYGNISPNTVGGRVFCIFFAAFGLPIFAIMFGEIGNRFAAVFEKLEGKLKSKISREKLRKGLVLLLLVTTLLVFCLIFPALIFTAVERWTFHEAFYYSFITLTTIGFGDFVVGTNPDLTYIGIYRVAVYFWILFGLAFMAAVISVFSDLLKNKGKNPKDEEEEAVDGREAASQEDQTSPKPTKQINGTENKTLSYDESKQLMKGLSAEKLKMYTLPGSDEAVVTTSDEDTKSSQNGQLAE